MFFRMDSVKDNACFEESRLYSAINEPTVDTWKIVQEEMKKNKEIARFKGSRNQTFLHLVAQRCDRQTADFLLPVIYQLASNGVDVNYLDSNEDTALSLCLSKGVPRSIVTAMLKVGANPELAWEAVQNAEDPLVVTVIQHAVPGLREATSSGDLEKVKLLLDSLFFIYPEQDIRNLITSDSVSDEVRSLLSARLDTVRFAHAAMAHDLKRMKRLLENEKHVVDPNVVDMHRLLDGGNTISWPLLAELIRLRNDEAARLLIESNADVNLRISEQGGDHNEVPLFVWTITKNFLCEKSLVRLLMERADLSLVDSSNAAEFLYGLWKNDCSVIDLRKAFDRGVQLSARDSSGYTIRDRILLEAIDYDVGLLKTSLRFVDDYVINLARQEEIEKLERLAADGYEYIDAVDSEGRTTTQIVSQEHKVRSIAFYDHLPRSQVRQHYPNIL